MADVDFVGRVFGKISLVTFGACVIVGSLSDIYTHGYCTADSAGYVAEDIIKDRLEFPNSAKFVYGSDDHVYLNGGCKFTVTGHVDGESILGFKRRAAWIASFVIDKNDLKAKSVDYVNIN